MRKTAKVARALILIGISVAGAVEIERYCARAAVRAVVAGFNGKRAFNDLCQLVQLGPRPAGSENLERARAYIERQLSVAGAEIREDPFVATTPMGKIPMTNVIGVIHGENPTVVILAGHYDTAAINGVRFVGANDGGSSAAFLLEMARVLSNRKNTFTYWIVFFDGEEALKQWSASDSLYGSRHLAEKLFREGNLGQIKALILVDMAADRHLNILRESNSTPWLSELVFKTACTLDYQKSFSGGTFPVEDDHLPFLAKGIPSVDIIDLTPFGSYHHTAQDSIDKCSPESLEVVGRVVLATLAELERTG
jgi:Zn-dependent M28 family amino/carboxypeptidase